jgi:hypothetical protein
VSNSELYRAAVLEAGDRAQFALTQADPAAVGRLLEWAHTQYAKAGAQLATLAGHREGGVAIPAVGALAELMGLLHSAAAPHSIPLQTDWITRVRFCFVLLFGGLVHSPQRSSLGTRAAIWRKGAEGDRP